MNKYTELEEKILTLISDHCMNHPCHDHCYEKDCILFNIEKLITKDTLPASKYTLG